MNEEEALGALLGGSIIVIAFIAIIAIALIAVVIVAEWKLFKKAGKNGWEALIPFYSTWVLIEISGLNWWYFLIAMAGSIISLLGIEGLGTITSLASYAVNFFVYYNIAKKTHQNEVLYGVLGIFVPFVPTLMVGFSKNITFDNNVTVSPNGPFNAK